jgi:hypothetical protein
MFAPFGVEQSRAAYSKEGIGAFKDGFWIDADLCYCKTSKVKYWIPPHKIRYISKDTVMTPDSV